MKPTWEGVYPAVLTMFKANGSLDIPEYQKNIRFQMESGVHGVILGGSLGESSTLTHPERMDLLKATLELTRGKIPAIVNIAEGATGNAIKLAEQAEKNGADGLMVLPPMMYKATEAETVHYFRTIAQSTSLPILVYNNPVDYKIDITPDMFADMLDLSNIEAVKESTRDISNVTRLRTRFGNRLKIMCGVDTLCLEELLMGADGLVAGLVDAFPRETVVLYHLAKQGRIEEARKIYNWFLPILELDISPQLVQNIKLAAVMTGIGTEHLRPPRQPLQGTERQRVIDLIQRGLDTRPEMPEV
ncbi:MAG: dihydrodipicolinate synthase family protein [Bacteroidetes bacterium]|nr:MAG: dihydrodipicolinate synthase family protein [Bacteroidota bacterium]